MSFHRVLRTLFWRLALALLNVAFTMLFVIVSAALVIAPLYGVGYVIATYLQALSISPIIALLSFLNDGLFLLIGIIFLTLLVLAGVGVAVVALFLLVQDGINSLRVRVLRKMYDASRRPSSGAEQLCLYLRPFDVDRKISSVSHDHIVNSLREIQERHANTGLLDRLVAPRGTPQLILAGIESLSVDYGSTFERRLTEAFSPHGISVALGAPSEIGGLATIASDDSNWKNCVSELIELASVIVCVPSMNPGTAWEIDELIARGLLNRTIFVWPSNGHIFGVSGPSEGEKKFGERYWSDLFSRFSNLPMPNADPNRNYFFTYRYDPDIPRKTIVDNVVYWPNEQFAGLEELLVRAMKSGRSHANSVCAVSK